MDEQKLSELYSRISKHSQYHLPALDIVGLVEGNMEIIHQHYERERLDFLLRKINVEGKRVLDIGGNTGYFSFELLNSGARSVAFYEGNEDHAEFVREAAELLNLSGKIKVHSQYFSFTDNDTHSEYDIVLLLNVLHHVGDDYGEKFRTISSAKSEIIRELIFASEKGEYVFFQLGFNWHGDRNMPLFANGTKSEMISFVQDGIKDYCDILHVGIAERDESSGTITYNEPTCWNIKRDDSIGEFLNRPLFILRNKFFA